MKRKYLMPEIQVIELHNECAILVFSDPHNPNNQDGGWIGGDLEDRELD